MADIKTKARLTFNEIKFWLNEITSCKERQKRELVERNQYPYLVEYYEGEQGGGDSQSRLAVINEYFPNINSLIAEVMYQNPDIIIESGKPDAEDNGPIMKAALNYAFKKLGALTENKLALFDMFMAGYSAVEVAHINVNHVESLPKAEGKKGIIDRINSKLRGDDQIEEEVEKTLPTKEEKYSTPDETYLRRWNPLNVLLDYRADRIKDMRYLIKVIRMSQAEFAARYPGFKDEVDVSGSIPFTQQMREQDAKCVTLYEFQLKQRDKYVHFIVSPSYKLREIDYWERPYTTNGFDIKIGTLHKYGKLYPISVAKINKSIQDNKNDYATFMMEVAEKNIPKRGFNKNKVGADGLRALNSTVVNQAVPVDGGQESIWTIANTNVSNENKELLAMFDRHQDKLFSVSAQRSGQTGKAKFATELEIQEAGFVARQGDIQEGLRQLIREELETLKDIIVQFWDKPMWFKITDSGQPTWYEPQIDPITGEVLNPLTDILTLDYELDVDITSSFKPNKERKKKELIEFATWITNPNVLQFAMAQGFMIDIDVIRRVAKEWGWNSENIIKQLPPEVLAQQGQEGAEGVPQGGEVEAPQPQQL